MFRLVARSSGVNLDVDPDVILAADTEREITLAQNINGSKVQVIMGDTIKVLVDLSFRSPL